MPTFDQTYDFGGPDRPTTWTPMRSELRAWFRMHAKSLAPAYEGAVELLATPLFPGRVRFIAHAVRDIANILVFALEPQCKGQRVQYEDHLDKIQQQWRSPDGVCQHEGPSPLVDNVTIPLELARLINDLVLRHRERRSRPSAHDLLFRYLVKGSLSPPASIDRLVTEFGKTAKWFMARAHFTAVPPSPVDEQDLQGKFQAFEGAIFGMVGTYFAGAGAIDEILKRANR